MIPVVVRGQVILGGNSKLNSYQLAILYKNITKYKQNLCKICWVVYQANLELSGNLIDFSYLYIYKLLKQNFEYCFGGMAP